MHKIRLHSRKKTQKAVPHSQCSYLPFSFTMFLQSGKIKFYSKFFFKVLHYSVNLKIQFLPAEAELKWILSSSIDHSSSRCVKYSTIFCRWFSSVCRCQQLQMSGNIRFWSILRKYTEILLDTDKHKAGCYLFYILLLR